MDKLSLIAQARNEIEAARRAPSGRSAKTVHGGHEKVLRQTVIALCAGRAASISLRAWAMSDSLSMDPPGGSGRGRQHRRGVPGGRPAVGLQIRPLVGERFTGAGTAP